jgi:hypothetical protein
MVRLGVDSPARHVCVDQTICRLATAQIHMQEPNREVLVCSRFNTIKDHLKSLLEMHRQLTHCHRFLFLFRTFVHQDGAVPSISDRLDRIREQRTDFDYTALATIEQLRES